MNRKFILVILVILVLLFFWTYKHKNNIIVDGENLVFKFFELYSKNNYNEMKKITCDNFSKLYLDDLENGIFGIKYIKHIELENYYMNENNNLIFKCNVIMNPSEISIYSSFETETSFYLELHNINGKLKLCKYYKN